LHCRSVAETHVTKGSYLSEVCGPLIEVNLLGNLLVPGERVHDSHLALGVLERLVVNAVRALDLLILHLAREPLLLHTSAVQDICLAKDLRSQRLRLAEQLASLDQL